MKEFKSQFFKEYKPSSHPRHGSDARTTYIRVLMRGYIKERGLIEKIKQGISNNDSSEELNKLTKEYENIVSDMKLCFKRLLSRQEHDNNERYIKKDRIIELSKKIDSLIEDNRNLNRRIKELSSKKSEKKEVVYH